jgi:hypothetical protein
LGEWGGQPEIVAMSELFNRPVEIYQQGSLKWPTYKINDDKVPKPENNENEFPVIRLSWHGKSHYNSVTTLSPSWIPVGNGMNDPEELKIRSKRNL